GARPRGHARGAGAVSDGERRLPHGEPLPVPDCGVRAPVMASPLTGDVNATDNPQDVPAEVPILIRPSSRCFRTRLLSLHRQSWRRPYAAGTASTTLTSLAVAVTPTRRNPAPANRAAYS